ncbi:MAG: F0F1 ATP synthase subunit A [Candidatus Terrybacteria bacterium]|nr:F0F1 ATP synthase subunit A [Candidatus Terrybacteria bacterium]
MELEISLAPQILTRFMGFPVTNTLLMSGAVSCLLVGLALFFAHTRRSVPGRFQAALEFVFEGLLALADGVTGNRKRTMRFAPIAFTIFFFVLFANLIEIIPGVESLIIELEGHRAPLLRSPSTDLNTTLALALIAVVSAQLWGIAALGPLKHIGKYFSLRGPIDFFVGMLEAVSEVAKVVSFSFRLFGNIFAGSVLLIVVSALLPAIVPIPFLGLEIFVGFVQALVFSVLALVFMTMATESH